MREVYSGVKIPEINIHNSCMVSEERVEPSKPMKNQHLVRFITISVLLLMIVYLSQLNAVAQEPTQWSLQQRIPGYSDTVQTPYLVADQNRTVHAFNSDWVDENQPVLAIVYSQWTLEQGWNMPVDILLSPIEQARIKGVFLDQSGMIHILFFGGADLRGDIYYSQAPVSLAGQARAWSEPVLVGERAITPDEAALTSNGQGHLVVVYSGNRDGQGLYAISSSDSGDTWSEPVPIFLTYSSELWPSALQLYTDEQGVVHAVWSVGNIAGNGERVYYARQEDNMIDWREPIELARPIGDVVEVDTPTIIEYENELFVIYHDAQPTTRHMRRSRDGGRTWTEAVRLFPHVGSNGPASLVVDSNNVLHMFFGNRVGEHPANHGMWHSIWQGGRWNGPEAIISGPQVQEEIGGNGFDPSFANAVVSQGNVILVTWTSDPQAGRNGAWYSYTVLDAPELPVVAIPTQVVFTPIPPATATPLSTPTLSSTPRQTLPTPDTAFPATEPISDPMAPLITGGAVVALFIMIVVIGRGVLLSHRR